LIPEQAVDGHRSGARLSQLKGAIKRSGRLLGQRSFTEGYIEGSRRSR
jgi:hypothetical protein